MKQIISILFIIALGISNISCSEENEPAENFAGTHWSYQKPHFEFEYASDTIAFQITQKPIKMGVNQLKGMFMAIAQEKWEHTLKALISKTATLYLLTYKTGSRKCSNYKHNICVTKTICN